MHLEPTRVAPGPWRHTWALGLVALGAAGIDFALRRGASAWWTARGGDHGWSWTALDVAGLVALAVAWVGVRSTRRGWPLSRLLLVSVAIMHPIGYVLAFGFHDVGLALAWTCVQSVVLASVWMIERRAATQVAIGTSIAASLGFAASLLAVS